MEVAVARAGVASVARAAEEVVAAAAAGTVVAAAEVVGRVGATQVEEAAAEVAPPMCLLRCAIYRQVGRVEEALFRLRLHTGHQEYPEYRRLQAYILEVPV